MKTFMKFKITLIFMENRITAEEITGHLIIALERYAETPFARGATAPLLFTDKKPGEEEGYYNIDWNMDGTGRRTYHIGSNQDLICLEDIEARRQTATLYWLRENIPAFVGATGFCMAKDLRKTLEEEVEESDIFQDPTIIVQQERDREDITIGVGSLSAVRDATARWYEILERGTDKRLAHYLKTGKGGKQIEQYIWFLERLAPFVDTGLMENTVLRRIIYDPKTMSINACVEEITAIFGKSVEVKHFKDYDTATRAVAALQEEITKKY